ncbi:hypothetical protein L7F22_022016 [Adiantum nelumboides]|nr:hypothetical protein [Adiantum nelumboides]
MVQVCGESVECKVSKERMWHGLFKDAHNCLPKALPHHVRCVEYPPGQLGFHLPGHERLIKLHKGLGVHLVAALSEEIHEAQKNLKEEEALVKEEAEKVAEELHKEEELVKAKAGEVVGGVEKEAKIKVEEVGKEAHALEEGVHKEAKEKVEEVDKKAHACEEGVHKGALLAEKEAKEKVEEVGKKVHFLDEGVHKEAHFAEKEVGAVAQEAAKVTETVLHKEADVAHKAASIVEKMLHKQGELVGATLHKVDAFLQHEELWVKEKIEEVHQEVLKISITVLAGGLMGVLFKHCKHSFELKDSPHGHGSIFHWTSEFETLSSAVHYLHSYEKLKQHALAPFHSVESYLLKHDDYTHR